MAKCNWQKIKNTKLSIKPILVQEYNLFMYEISNIRFECFVRRKHAIFLLDHYLVWM